MSLHGAFTLDYRSLRRVRKSQIFSTTGSPSFLINLFVSLLSSSRILAQWLGFKIISLEQVPVLGIVVLSRQQVHVVRSSLVSVCAQFLPLYPGTGFPVVCKCSSIGRPSPTAWAVMAQPDSAKGNVMKSKLVYVLRTTIYITYITTHSTVRNWRHPLNQSERAISLFIQWNCSDTYRHGTVTVQNWRHTLNQSERAISPRQWKCSGTVSSWSRHGTWFLPWVFPAKFMGNVLYV